MGEPTQVNGEGPLIRVEDDRTGMSDEALRRAVLDHLQFTRAKDLRTGTLLDINHAVAHAARDRLVYRWLQTDRSYVEQDVKQVCYLSAEYLLGRQLAANLLNLGLLTRARKGLLPYGIDLDAALEAEPDPGLGNGGLGRLAACFMDSLAALEYPATGYGIRYEFGIFRQEMKDGWQVEQPDDWLRTTNPWEIARPESQVEVGFGGRVEHHQVDGRLRVSWNPDTTVFGVPYDTPVAGFGADNNTVNTLRLWSAKASTQFDLAVFNDGDYRRAVEQKAVSESISKVLYPKDSSREGRELRLRQQYFFVACSVRDILTRYRANHADFSALPDRVAIQLNDTHPAIAVAELMRLLVDVHHLDWDQAWSLTRRTIAYTNHTLLPEALERWPLDLLGGLLPRHLEIIREIDRRFQLEIHIHAPHDEPRKERMAIIGPDGVRMAHLCVVGSHTVNGVAELHSQLLRDRVLHEFADLWPQRFTNVTNGVTPRRWLLQCNPRLATLIARRVGRSVVTDLTQIEGILPLADDAEFLDDVASTKRANKRSLARWARTTLDLRIDPDTLFDVQVKRIHEYKRQLMLCLHVIHLYRLVKFEGAVIVPRTVLVGGKAAPGYSQAKQHVKLVNDVATIVNRDPAVRGQLQLHFLPNYNVSMAERVIPAADLSEQISLAGMEASGTGNMKFQMNGALTIGTLDGANIEIREEVGPENFFLFGLDAEQVHAAKSAGYRPADHIARSEPLQAAIALLETGYFNPEERELHRAIAHYLRTSDPFLVCADFDDYCATQRVAADTWRDPARWWPMTVRNIARSGKFSSDRTIREYATRIWKLQRVHVDLPEDDAP